jgi:hypothetical protein
MAFLFDKASCNDENERQVKRITVTHTELMTFGHHVHMIC